MHEVEKKPFEAIKYIAIRDTVTTLKIPKFFKTSLAKLAAKLDKQPEDTRIFGRYHNLDWEKASQKPGCLGMIGMLFFQKWDIEICISTNESVAAEGKIYSDESPAYTNTLQLVHLGAYKEVGKGYSRIIEHAEENGLKLAPSSFEIYLNDPGKVEEDKLETLLVVPLES